MRGKLHARGPGDDERAVRDTKSADRVIAAIAGRQRGVISRAQLLVAGIDGGAIERRLRAGRLHPVHRGIYLVGHSVMADRAPEVAALLACGRGAIVSHVSAANLLQLRPYPAKPRPVDITLVGRQVARRPGISVHHVRALDRRDVRPVDGIPATSAPRTLLDLATVLPPYLLERTVAEAVVRRLARRGDLTDQIARTRADQEPGHYDGSSTSTAARLSRDRKRSGECSASSGQPSCPRRE